MCDEYVYLNLFGYEWMPAADDSSSKIPSSSATPAEQSKMGGEKDKRKHNQHNHGQHQQKQNNQQQQKHQQKQKPQQQQQHQQEQPYYLRSHNKTVENKTPTVEANTDEGLDVQVTWLPHDEKTQIHVAFADFKRADFDVVILPLKVNLTGINVFHEEICNRYYGSLIPGLGTQLFRGDVKSCGKGKDFACKNIITGILYDYNKANRNKDLIHKLLKKAIKEEWKKTDTFTMGIPVQFDGLYDPFDIINGIMNIRRKGDKKQLHCYLCCKQSDTDFLKPFIMKVDKFMQHYKSPKRCTSSTLKDVFPMLDVSVNIELKGILDTECECIVAAIGGKFQLDSGRLTQAIANKAGHELQKEVYKIVNKNKYQRGDVIECNPGRLSQVGMKLILFGQLPKWMPGQNNEELANMMSNFVKECLFRADKRECRSVAFPALGSGYLSYPEDVIVQSILGGVKEYATTEMNGIISRVVIAYHDAGNNYLYETFVTEIGKLPFSRGKPKQSAGPSNDGMNEMLAGYESRMNGSPEVNRHPSMSEKSSQPVKADKSSNESMNKSVDACEMICGDMTADVNTGIMEYLKGKNLIENFKTKLTERFGVQIVCNGDKMVIKGSMESIINAETCLNEGSFYESMFQNTNDDEEVSNITEQEPKMNCNNSEHEPKRMCNSPQEEPKRVCNSPQEEPKRHCKTPEHEPETKTVCHTPEQGPNKANIEAEAYRSKENTCRQHPITVSKQPLSPVGINVIRLAISNLSLHIFECKNMFSFETDIKVVTIGQKTAEKTKEKVEDRSKFLQEVLEKFPECQKALDTWTNKTIGDEIEIDNLNKQADTCNCVMVVVAPRIVQTIKSSHDKHKFKEEIKCITRKILDKAIDMKAESITLPILVHTADEGAITMCAASMAGIIVEYMHSNTSLKHFNVVVESLRIGKILSGEVKKVTRK